VTDGTTATPRARRPSTTAGETAPGTAVTWSQPGARNQNGETVWNRSALSAMRAYAVSAFHQGSHVEDSRGDG
jgi:hypothetical protein